MKRKEVYLILMEIIDSINTINAKTIGRDELTLEPEILNKLIEARQAVIAVTELFEQ